MEKWIETILMVEPISGPRTGRDFPLDMLRYANCAPARESDTFAMEARGRVMLRRYSKDGETSMLRAAAARWESMGWRVVAHCESRDEAQKWDEG